MKALASFTMLALGIIHAAADSYCPEGEVKGCAGGARAACGVIDR